MSDARVLSAGVLIIGSLLWDKDRQRWRDERLDLTRSELVSVPIRYGRKSGKRRGHTYTMVFSRNAPAGSARVVRCLHAIASANDLITEALKLWEAEALFLNTGRIAASWGCVALLCNPGREIPIDLLTAWSERVNNEPDYGNVSQAAGEVSLISNEGMLHVDWPKRIEGGTAVDLDLLLATANDPTFTGTPPSYPDVSTIVSAWNRAAQEHSEYFWRNLDHGITTFQDDEIRAGLRKRREEGA